MFAKKYAATQKQQRKVIIAMQKKYAKIIAKAKKDFEKRVRHRVSKT